MTNIANKTIDTSHISDRIANPIYTHDELKDKQILAEVAKRWFKIEDLDWKELMNTLPPEVIATMWDTKLLIEDCFSVTQSTFQDRHGNITDTNGNPITSHESKKLWVIKATNQEDVQTVKENIRVY